MYMVLFFAHIPFVANRFSAQWQRRGCNRTFDPFQGFFRDLGIFLGIFGTV